MTALRAIRQCKGGFTLIEIMIAVLIIGVLLSLAMPVFAKARDNARTKSCVKNLRQIDQAKVQAALDLGVAEGAPLSFETLVPDYLKSQPVCPAGGTYDCTTLGTDATCTVAEHIN